MIPKFNDRIMYVDGLKEQVFSTINSIHGILYINDDYSINTIDGNKLGVSITENNFSATNLKVLGNCESNKVQTYQSVTINEIEFPSSISVTDNKGDFLIHTEDSQKWSSDILDDWLENKIKQHFKDKYKSIPRGAIHWCYMSLDDYKNLPSDDPLKTNYLLCDGRKYKKTEYKELSEILKTVIRHKRNENPDYYYPEKIDNSIDQEYFYVPDLRHMFISNVQNESNDSGTYLPDCNSVNEKLDRKNHRHFVSYGVWKLNPFGEYAQSNELDYPNKFKFDENNGWYNKIGDEDYNPTQPIINAEQAYNNSNVKLENGDEIGILPLHNNPYTTYNDGMIGFGHNTSQNKGVDSIPVGIFFQKTNHKDSPINGDFAGLSSNDIDSFIPSTNQQSQEKMQSDYTKVSKGHENYPNFYPMLPLIKI